MRTCRARLHLGPIAFFVGSLLLVATATTADPLDLDGFFVNVPFAFVAGGKTLPAGTYHVGLLPSDTDPEVLATLQSTASDHFPRIVSQSVAVKNVITELRGPDAERPRLVFAKVGDRQVLEEIED